MKVAFLGNMNNNAFSAARYLRDRGVDCEVLIFSGESSHFHPSADTYDLDYMSFCRELSWGYSSLNLNTVNKTDIKRDLSEFDLVIGDGPAPAFCDLIQRPLDVFIPCGADLVTMTKYPRRIRHRSMFRLAYHQRRGIKNSRIVCMDLTNEAMERELRIIAGAPPRWTVGVPMVYTGIYNPESIRHFKDRTYWHHEFQKIRENCNLMVFSPSRHLFGIEGQPEVYNKGTEKLLQAWGRFVQSSSNFNARLVFVEYGDDVLRSKAMIRDLGVEHTVHWLPVMNRKDLMVGMSMADVVCSEFSFSWPSGGVIYEALVMNKPVLGYRQDHLYTTRYPSLYPMLNAHTSEDILQRLVEFSTASLDEKSKYHQGLSWYQRYTVDPWLSECMKLFQ